MTITVHTHLSNGADQRDFHLTVNDEAEEAIRFSFNPSALERVTRLKALAAAFLSEVDNVLIAVPAAGREFAIAKTQMQTASMWAVLGATKGL